MVGNVTQISAGDVITFISPAGSFSEIPKYMDESTINYQNDISVPLVGPIPTGLFMDIPGDAFPAFSNVPIPELQPLSLTSPTTGQTVTAETESAWQAVSNSNAYLSLSAYSDITDSTYSSVVCLATDDGSFSFSAASKAELGSSFSASSWSISREQRTFLQQDNAKLVVRRYSFDY